MVTDDAVKGVRTENTKHIMKLSLHVQSEFR